MIIRVPPPLNWLMSICKPLNIEFETRIDRKEYRVAIRNRLKTLACNNKIERTTRLKGNAPVLWKLPSTDNSY